MNKIRREVQNLILMFSAAIFIAFVVVIGLVYYLGSSGTYLLRDVLVSPKALEQLTFLAYNPATERQETFVFSEIEFIYVEKNGKEWGRFRVSPKSYAAFYKSISKLRSIFQIDEEFVQQFNLINPSSLTIFVRAKNHVSQMTKGFVFQQIELLEGGLFRVRMRENLQLTGEWVYFHEPGIYRKAVELFAPTVMN